MKYSKKCECCGSVVTAYTHKLWLQQVEMLWKIISFYHKNHRPAILSELWLTPVQYSIFSKMKHWNIVEQQMFQKDWKMIFWRVPKRKWFSFYEWQIPIENRSASMNGKTLPLDHEAWKTDKEWRRLVYRREIEAWKSKTHEEYKDEKRKFRLRNLFE